MARLTVGARASYALAGHEAQQLGAPLLEVEHMVLGLLKAADLAHAGEQLSGLKAEELTALREECRGFDVAVRGAGLDPVRARRRLRALVARPDAGPGSATARGSSQWRTLLMRAEDLAKDGEIAIGALARAAFTLGAHDVERVLVEQNVRREALLASLGGAAPAAAGEEAAGGPSAGAAGDDPQTSRELRRILRYGRDLTALARAGKLRPAIARDDEIKQVARILTQAQKGNPLLIGEPGVGKTAIVEGLALRLLAIEAPALRRLRIVELSIGALVAGTTYRGEFEARIQEVLAAAEKEPDLVYFLDEVHLLLGAGAGSGPMDAANLIKPGLARGTLRCIAATTIAEYRQHIERDAALERRFQLVWVEEPSRDATLRILEGLRPGLAEHHGLAIDDEALAAAVDLSIRYLPDQRLPDKAIDLIDQACARTMLETFSAKAAAGSRVARAQVAAVVSERCRVPIERLTEDERERLARLEQILGARVLGQPRAVRAVAETVRAARSGLRDERRPQAVLLFVGPTGTGKTELARALAEALFGGEERLIRFDMSEFSEKHMVARLIGSPPGYVGHEEGGQLTDAVRTRPHSVVLFDEMEKAHPDVFSLFLQIFDDGRLTDSRGRIASFRDAVIVLTSNLGATAAGPARPIGFARQGEAPAPAFDADAAREAAYREAVAGVLAPELMNRIQKVVVFQPLPREVVGGIVDRSLERLNRRLLGRGLRVVLEAAARALLVERGYSEEFGARALERAVQEAIEEPLARMLVARRIEGEVRVAARDGELLLQHGLAEGR